MTSTPSAVTGANVRAEMARRDVSQVALAEAIDMGQPSLSKRLRGVTPFDINELSAVAEYLGVPLSNLLPSEVPAA